MRFDCVHECNELLVRRWELKLSTEDIDRSVWEGCEEGLMSHYSICDVSAFLLTTGRWLLGEVLKGIKSMWSAIETNNGQFAFYSFCVQIF
jgi:hypothetical protein